MPKCASYTMQYSDIVQFLDLIISLFLSINFLIKIVFRKSTIITATMYCINVMAPSKLKSHHHNSLFIVSYIDRQSSDL